MPFVTPMILLVNSEGTILKYWQGDPNSAVRLEIIRAITQPLDATNRPRTLPSGQMMFTLSDLRQVSRNTPLVILNAYERSVFGVMQYNAPAVNIPYDELPFRSKRELDPTKLYVLDCTFFHETLCGQLIDRLTIDGLKAAAMDNSGLGQPQRREGS